MKKLLFVVALAVTGLMSAKDVKFDHSYESNIIGGWCEIRIYRINADGSRTLVDYSYTYEQSESACRAKSQLMLMAAEIKSHTES